MAEISGKIWNEVRGGVTKGIDDFLNDRLRSGEFDSGDAVVYDIATAILSADIAGLCRFNDRNYMWMNRLMQININEKNMRFYAQGNNSHRFGESDLLDAEIPRYSYTNGLNYLDATDRIRGEEILGISATQGIGDDGFYGSSHVISPDNFDYGNLYPDDLDALTGDAARSKWKADNPDSILAKTKRMFYQGKMNTIISKFGTAADGQSHNLSYKGSKRTKYGESHGRNLLTASSEKTGVSQYTFNGYNNPYCRVWTHHYQYDKYFKTIRPFHYIDRNGKYASTKGVVDFHKWNSFAQEKTEFGFGWKNGDAGWDKSVLDTTKGGDGIVKIAPKYINGAKSNIHTKDCMFSIENLAWKGYDPYSFEKALSWEQRGPLGGRIMWFPPYGITFNETTNVNWSSNTFIGRGEDVYTYVNTQRSGTLSFLMVVDHPSVIDYATWHDETGRVQDTDMLRFFAGCDSLDPDDPNSIMSVVQPTPLTDEYLNNYQSPVYAYPKVTPPPQKPEDPPKDVVTVTFYVFYPNNYSGQFDAPGKAVAYLLSGQGAGKRDDGKTDVDYDFKNIVETGERQGYEMEVDQSDGLSPVDSIAALEADGNFIYAFADSYDKIKTRKDRNSYKWYYRVDGQYSTSDSLYGNTYGQRLISTDGKNVKPTITNGTVTNTNYLDLKSFMLNSTSAAWDSGWKSDADDTHIYCSFADFAYSVALLKGYESTKSYLNDRKEGGTINVGDEERDKCEYIKELLEKKYLSKIDGVGFSNSHGYNSKKEVNKKRNKLLSENRIKTIAGWLRGEGIEVGDVTTSDQPGVSDNVEPHQNSGFNAKLWRSARITLTFTNEHTEKIAKLHNDYEEAMSEYKKYTGYTEAGKDKDGRTLYKNDDGTLWIELDDGTLVRNDVGEETGISNMRGRSQSQYWGKTASGGYGWDDSTASGNRYYTDGAIQQKWDKNVDTSLDTVIGGGERNKLRYDQEYYFFRTLEKKDPLVFNKLMDKIKYFDPAFHSMTPEGFNARLTFLNQCTRQGNTISMSDINGQTANNLAFGRPPFCVLRIGDFYNQMIVIENINIDYSVSDGIQWDMNTEGIGMQPLLAQINISFKFIGGGDIAGPIRRLQNAMSFNYYANARFYDNRADRIAYLSANDYKVLGAVGNHEIDFENKDTYAYVTQMYAKKKPFNMDELKTVGNLNRDLKETEAREDAKERERQKEIKDFFDRVMPQPGRIKFNS